MALKLLITVLLYVTFNTDRFNAITRQIYFNLSDEGLIFLPNDYQALFLAQTFADSFVQCGIVCHQDINCRIFDMDPATRRCRTFQGSINSMGQLISDANFFRSRVGSFQLNPIDFISCGQTCSLCEHGRYLTCANQTCNCPITTYFDGSICQSQKLLGAFCLTVNECRQDLNYTCLRRGQCGPFSIEDGVTVGGYGNGSHANDSRGLNNPTGIAIDAYDDIYVADTDNHRVVKLDNHSGIGVIVAGTGMNGNNVNELNGPRCVDVDADLNLYICDSLNFRMMIWTANSTFGYIIAGNGTSGNTATLIAVPTGVVVDITRNIYIVDDWNSPIIKCEKNATTGVLVAGTGVNGNNSDQLSSPFNMFLDESNGFMYVPERFNARVKRFSLNGSRNGTIVAGGNGLGSDSNQLNRPHDVCVSCRTGDIYIADYANHRIQLWRHGATTGVTFAGITSVPGTNASELREPNGVRLNKNETYLYVSDTGNHRIQRFKLI